VSPNFDKMLTANQALIAIDSTNAVAWNNLGMKYRYRREHATSEPYFRRAARLAPDIPLFIANTAITLVNLGRYREADSAMRVLEQLAPRAAMVPRDKLWLILGRGPIDSVGVAVARLPFAAERAWGERMRGRLREARRLEIAGQTEAAAAGLVMPPLIDSLPGIEAELWLVGPTSDAVRRLDTLLAHNPIRALAPRERPYLALATDFARAGHPDRARALMTEYDHDMTDTVIRREQERERYDALGEIALADGRWQEAVTSFGVSRRIGSNAFNTCPSCIYEHLARAYDAGGQRDSALANYERYLTAPFAIRLVADASYRARVERRIGELYDAAGDTTRATAHYAAFVSLWKDADPALQPAVTAVRRRMVQLRR
jgi:tetratricopeptide (TPR) repeat protein